jgi:hypothetical protein
MNKMIPKIKQSFLFMKKTLFSFQQISKSKIQNKWKWEEAKSNLETHSLHLFIYQSKKKNKDKILTLLSVATKKYVKIKSMNNQCKKQRKNINL